MEVTTVSPSPASSTEGNNLSQTDVTNVAIHSGTLLICLCGLAGNGAVLWLFSLKSRKSGIFDMAIGDFLFLLFTVSSTLLFLVEDVFCSPIVPSMYVSFLFKLSVVSCFWVLYVISRDVVDVYKLVQLCCSCDLPEYLRCVVHNVQYGAFLVPFAVISALIFLCPSHEQGNCWAALIYIYAIILLLFVALMVISRTINIIKAKSGSKKQQPKRRHIVFLIIVLFTLLLNLCNFLQQFDYFLMSSQVFFLLTCIHSSIKPFIYFLAGSSWRHCSMGSLRLSLQRVFEEKKE